MFLDRYNPTSALLAVLLAASPAFAQSPAVDPAKLKAIPERMQKFVDDGELAGAVTAVGRADGVLELDAVGFANLETKSPMDKNSLFRIASMTKPMTCLAVMMLADEGKLNPEDPVEKYLPEFKGQMVVAAKDKDSVTLKKPSRPIQIRDLMTHTSGLPTYPAGIADVYSKRNRTLADTTLVISQRPLDFEPGSKWSYCNPGIDTLGRIVEVVSGESFAAFMQKRLFDSLKMSDTTFFPTPDQAKRIPVCYGPGKDGKLAPSTGMVVDYVADGKHPIPAGGLFSTAADVASLYRCLLNKGQLDGKRVISEKALAEMTKVQTGELTAGFTNGMAFGYGFAVVKTPTGVTEMLSPGSFGHGGAFGTQSWADPGQDLFCILLIQRTGLKNGDASEMRKELQRLAVAAIKK